MRIITDHIDQISELCSANGVKALFAFGSVTNDKFSTGSDVDLVVEIANTDPLGYSDSYFNLKFGLEALLQREIDLLENKAVRNPYVKEEIERTKILVYGN